MAERRVLDDRVVAAMDFCASTRPGVKEKLYHLWAFNESYAMTVAEYSVMLLLVAESLGGASNKQAFAHEAGTVGNALRGEPRYTPLEKDAVRAHLGTMGRIANVGMPERIKQQGPVLLPRGY